MNCQDAKIIVQNVSNNITEFKKYTNRATKYQDLIWSVFDHIKTFIRENFQSLPKFRVHVSKPNPTLRSPLIIWTLWCFNEKHLKRQVVKKILQEFPDHSFSMTLQKTEDPDYINKYILWLK